MYYILDALLRKENFGGLAINRLGNFVSFNNSGYKILASIYKQPLTINEIAEKSNILSAHISEFVERMKNENIVKEVSQNDNTIHGKVVLNNENNNANFLRAPLNASLDITNKCNQKCKFCYTDNDYLNANVSTISDTDVLEIVKKIGDAGVCFLNLLGGEPLARFDVLCSVFNFCQNNLPFLHCSFATNGTYNGGITKEKALRLSKYKNISVRFSINGYQDSHDKIVGLPGAFDTAINSILNLKKYSPELLLNVNCVLTSELLIDLEKLLDFLIIECGVRVVELMPIQIVGHASFNLLTSLTAEEFDKCKSTIIELNKKYREYNSYVGIGSKYINCNTIKIANKRIICGIPTTVNIDATGDCYFCHMTINHKEFCGGNILNENMETIWNSKEHLILLDKITQVYEECVSCSNYEFCKGGCKVGAYLQNGSWGSKDPSCPYL